MKKRLTIVLFLVVAFGVGSLQVQAQSNGPYRQGPMGGWGNQPVYQQYNYGYGQNYRPMYPAYRPMYGGNSLWANFMEFERRKNAWLFGW